MTASDKRVLSEVEGRALVERAQAALRGSGDEDLAALERWAAVRASFTGGELEHAISARVGHDDEAEWDLTERLLERCELVVLDDGQRGYMLGDGRRRRVLKELVESGALTKMDAEDHGRTPLARVFASYLRGKAPGIDSLPDDELGAAARVAAWLHPFHPRVPSPEEIRQRIEVRALLAPFRRLVGDHFRGREDVLRALRSYVDVLPSRSALESVQRFLQTFRDDPPLVLHGPGGVGKSTVIAKFVLDHVRQSSKEPLYFVYLDFDRPRVRAREPVTLLIEAARQIAVQLASRALREELFALGPRWSMRYTGSDSLAGDRLECVDELADVITRAIGGAPLLFVLDTFEEAQYRAGADLAPVYAILARLRERVPRLRVVIAGRRFPDELPHRAVPLGEFDAEAAQSFVRHLLWENKIAPEDLPARIYAIVGGNPLSLRLAVDVLRTAGQRGEVVEELRKSTRRLLLFRAEDNFVQGQLYKRILAHIHDEDARRIAHPGLTLRRITPRIIRDVLASACGLEGVDDARAKDLFDRLAREVALVDHDAGEPEPTLIHRSDVRRVMLRAMRVEDRALVDRIHRAAVKLYRSQEGLGARAEELYHRLCLGQSASTLDARWREGVEARLADALDDVEGSARAYLAARLGYSLEERELRDAELATWERATKSRVRRAMASGREKEALAMLRERSERGPRSPLSVVEGQLLLRLGMPEEAVTVLAKASEAAPPNLPAAELVELEKLHAQALIAAGRGAEAKKVLASAAQVLQPDEVEARIELELARARLEGEMSSQGGDFAPLMSLLRDPRSASVWKRPDLVKDLATTVGSAHPELLPDALRAVGLRVEGAAQQELGHLLANWETELATQGAALPLSRQVGIERSPRDFAKWLGEQPAKGAGRTLARWMKEHSKTVGATQLAEHVVRLFREG